MTGGVGTTPGRRLGRASHVGRVLSRVARSLSGMALVGICLFAPVVIAQTVDRPWESLPPTPSLPETAAKGWADVNGIRLWHARYSPAGPDAGSGADHAPTVLLLHGGFASSDYYGHLVPFLVARGYDVLVVDSRGQGRSSASSAPFSYALFASDIAALLRSLGIDRVDIVGWSDGGIVGIEMALHHPRLVHRVFAFGANVDVKGLKPDIDKSPVFARYLSRTEQEYAALSTTPQGFPSMSAKILAMWSHQPNYSRAELARIDKPVTVSDGEYDEALRPEHQVFIARSIRGANLVILPNVSHFAMLQNPAQFNDAVLAFLKYR